MGIKVIISPGLDGHQALRYTCEPGLGYYKVDDRRVHVIKNLASNILVYFEINE